jgi:hypothetical protein
MGSTSGFGCLLFYLILYVSWGGLWSARAERYLERQRAVRACRDIIICVGVASQKNARERVSKSRVSPESSVCEQQSVYIRLQ